MEFGLSIIFRDNLTSLSLVRCALKSILVSIWRAENALELGGADGCIVCEHIKIHQIVHFKMKHDFYGPLVISQLKTDKTNFNVCITSSLQILF